MSTCPSCNAPLQAGDRFCRQCGARIRKAPPASHEATNRPSPTRAKKAAAPLIVYVASAGHTQLLDVAERGARDHRAHPLVAKDARQVQELLRQLDASGERPEAVCLLGTNADLPHARFSDGKIGRASCRERV